MKNLVVILVAVIFFVGNSVVKAQNSDFEAFKKAQQSSFDSFKNQKNTEFEAFKKAKEAKLNDFVSKNQPEHGSFLKDVPYNELKASIKDYTQVPGEIPIGLFLKKESSNYLFKITKPVLSQTYLAGDFAIFSKLKGEGIDNIDKTFTFTFKKDVGKNVSLIKIVAIKKS